MARYPVAYRRARRAPRGFQAGGFPANDNRIGEVGIPGRRTPRKPAGGSPPMRIGWGTPVQITPRTQAALDAISAGPGALWEAALAYDYALQGIRQQNWVQYWQKCKDCNHGYPLEVYANGDCTWGCFTPWQSMNTIELDFGAGTTTVGTMYVGAGRVSFGVEQIHIEEVWTRTASAPAAPTSIPRARPDLGFTELNPNPTPVQDPFEFPLEWPFPLPQIGPVVRPSTKPEFAPKPKPWEQPSVQPSVSPLAVPAPVWTTTDPAVPGATPEAEAEVAPDTKGDPAWTTKPPSGSHVPAPARAKPPKPKEREGKLNVRTAAGAAWVAAEMGFSAVEFFNEANKTLPDGVRAPARAKPHEKAEAVYNNWDKVDVAAAFEVWANNTLEDFYFGVTAGAANRAANKHVGGGTGRGHVFGDMAGEASDMIPEVEISRETGEVFIDFGRYGKRSVTNWWK